MDRPKVEPEAEKRAAAFECYKMFVALCDAGFSEEQALKIVGAMLGGQK